MPEHESITALADMHEPKGAPQLTGGTSDAGKVYVSDGAGSGAWEKAPARTYGGICSKDSTIAIASIGTTAKKFAAFDADMPSNNTTPAHASDQITVTTAGDYEINFSVTLATAAAGDAGEYQFHLRVNDVEDASLGCRREMSGSADTGSAAFVGIVTLAANDVLTIYIESDDGGDSDDIVVEGAQFMCVLMKEA